MDEYTDHLFTPSSWADAEAKAGKSCWSYGESGQANVLFPTSLRLNESDKRNLPLSMICSRKSVEGLPAQNTSSLALDSESNFAVGEILDSGEAGSKEVLNCNNQVRKLINDQLKMENIALRYGTGLHSLNLNYSKQLPVVDSLSSSLSFSEANHAGCNSGKNLEHHKPLKDLQNLASLSQFWPSASYGGVSSLPAVMGQDATQDFGPQEVNLECHINAMGKKYDEQNMESHPPSSFASGLDMRTAADGVSFIPQSTSTSPACNCSGKPRVRARRGQATDPHSIAERLRREKIAERMKNLQELVPNSSKADKASMLDEIIDYVKFLQLQVKVLSMSRLGAAGAVIPLITDGQAEGSKNLSLSSRAAGVAIDVAPSPDRIAFEQEVLKLMESNMTAAVQYLQSRGLCLMPMTLAASISGRKASSSSSGSDEKKTPLVNGLVHSDSGTSWSSSNSSCNFPSGCNPISQISHGGITNPKQLRSRDSIICDVAMDFSS